MSTNREVVTEALREISVLDADETASNEDATLALRQLNRMMAILAADGIDLGFPPQDNLSDDFPLDDTAEAQVISLLALRLTKVFPAATIPPGLIADADEAKGQLLRAAALSNMEESSVLHAPIGERSAWTYNIVSDD